VVTVRKNFGARHHGCQSSADLGGETFSSVAVRGLSSTSHIETTPDSDRQLAAGLVNTLHELEAACRRCFAVFILHIQRAVCCRVPPRRSGAIYHSGQSTHAVSSCLAGLSMQAPLHQVVNRRLVRHTSNRRAAAFTKLLISRCHCLMQPYVGVLQLRCCLQLHGSSCSPLDILKRPRG
jgi:hypothetical protein